MPRTRRAKFKGECKAWVVRAKWVGLSDDAAKPFVCGRYYFSTPAPTHEGVRWAIFPTKRAAQKAITARVDGVWNQKHWRAVPMRVSVMVSEL